MKAFLLLIAAAIAIILVESRGGNQRQSTGTARPAISCPAVDGAHQGAESTEPYWRDGLLKLYTGDGSGQFMSRGMAFLISANGVVATAYHCVSGSREIRVSDTQRSYSAKVLNVIPGADLAILSISRADASFPFFSLSSSMAPCAAFGAPDPYYRVERGDVSLVARFLIPPGDDEWIEMRSNSVRPGYSGGPVVDASGKVVGMSVAVMVNDNRCLALSARTVRKYAVEAATLPPKSCDMIAWRQRNLDMHLITSANAPHNWYVEAIGHWPAKGAINPDYTQTLRGLAKALEYDPRYVPALVATAEIFTNMKRFRDAKNFYLLAIEADPDDPNVPRERAAIAYLERCMENERGGNEAQNEHAALH